MYRGTTPTIKFKVNSEELDLTSLSQVWVTFKSSTKTLVKDLDDCVIDAENGTISVTLSQEETLSFSSMHIEVQIRFLDKDDKAFASPVKEMIVNKILTEGVINNA